MPGRKYSPSSGSGPYRYGFNGKENDNDVKGEGNQQDYGMRIYDPRLGRFLSVDPIRKDYPELTPYQFASNSPIGGIDLDGGEILPVNSSIYLQKFSGSFTIFGKVYTTYDVETVYNNIPDVLKNPSTLDLKFTRGGPVTPFGRDWDSKIDGPYFSSPGRFFNKGPEFFGKAEDAGPPSSSSTQGTYSFKADAPNDKSVDANRDAASRTASKANGLRHLVGLAINQLNKSIWEASGKESADRFAFYTATNLVDKYLNKKLIGDKNVTDPLGRINLINFITDGTLPTRNSKIENLTLQQLENNLRVIYTGIQILYKEKLSYQKALDQTTDDLIKKYKEKGGKIQFEKVYKFERPK